MTWCYWRYWLFTQCQPSSDKGELVSGDLGWERFAYLSASVCPLKTYFVLLPNFVCFFPVCLFFCFYTAVHWALLAVVLSTVKLTSEWWSSQEWILTEACCCCCFLYLSVFKAVLVGEAGQAAILFLTGNKEMIYKKNKNKNTASLRQHNNIFSLKQPPGLLEDYPSGVDPDAECCDVWWDLKVDNRSRGTLKRTHPPCQHRTSLSSSAACRLCNSRLKLCLLVLVLLHTVASLTASHNATGMGLPAITPLEESPANEEWLSCQEEVRLLRGGGDSLAMATDVEKYSHSCVNGCSVCLWRFCNAFWQMENVGRFETKDTQINQNK